MLLTSVVKGLEFAAVKGDLNVEVASIAYDSREVIEGSVFVAISGFREDGHTFVGKAIEMGAKTVIVEKNISVEEDITVLQVANTRLALARIASNFYDNPTDKLNLIGVTGTNGKTSTTYFLKSIFEQADKATGLIGTIGTMINHKLIKNKNTTPESQNLQQIFAEMVDAEIDQGIMEVSSHALNLHRVAYCSFNTGIFTNLSPDHLELHNNMEEYFRVKAELFKLTGDYNVINTDDEYGKKLIEEVKDYDVELVTYGIENKADIYASDIHFEADSTTYTVNTPKGKAEITVNIPGVIYVYNSLAAIAGAYCHGISLKDIQEGINDIESIKGRLEVVYKHNNYKVVVDFAHTEDSLEKALKTLKPYAKGRLIVVFGVYAADGEPGRQKRRAMGKVAAEYADFSIVTSDNPKDQDPDLIIDEIVDAIKEEESEFKAIVDRKEAIQYAIINSKKDDTILIAGKGHETTQVIGKTEIPFNEAELVIETLRNRDQLVIK